MISTIPRAFKNTLLGSFLLWVLLTTLIPQTISKYSDSQILHSNFTSDIYPYSSLTVPSPLHITDSDVYFVIGHPDDEVMFFAPSLIELGKSKYNNRLKVICFSHGDAVDPSLGAIRMQELKNLARILPVQEVVILDGYEDSMEVQWDAEHVAASLNQVMGPIKERHVVITFDENGVSGHPNHISLYHGCKHYFASYHKKAPRNLYVLKSLGFLEKYSFTLLTNIELLILYISKAVLKNILKVGVNISFFPNHFEKNSIKFYSDLNSLSLAYSAMAHGHFSQMVWFRYGWLVFSRYLTYNHLIQVY